MPRPGGWRYTISPETLVPGRVLFYTLAPCKMMANLPTRRRLPRPRRRPPGTGDGSAVSSFLAFLP